MILGELYWRPVVLSANASLRSSLLRVSDTAFRFRNAGPFPNLGKSKRFSIWLQRMKQTCASST